MQTANSQPSADITSIDAVAPQRAIFGGFLMGLANLVPGVSGGTMILALGLYDRFIGSIADVTRLRFKRSSILFLGWIGLGGVLAIGLLSGVAVDLVIHHRWIMYSLFVGMTLGGVPELWKQCRPLTPRVALGALFGIAVMAALAWGLSRTQIPRNTAVFVVVGSIAASSMILPGISGSYLLLILGMYEVVIGSIKVTLHGDRAEGLAVLVPVGIGAVLGVALLSNVLKFALARAPRVSHAVLLGLLCGSVLGLWPFQQSVHEELAHRPTRKATVMLLAGEDLTAVHAEFGADLVIDEPRAAELRERYSGKTPDELKAMSEELERFGPSVLQIASAFGLLLVGGLLTRLLGRGERAD